MGVATHLTCLSCGGSFELALSPPKCPKCQLLLQVRVELSGIGPERKEEILARRDHSIWKWRELLPIENEANMVTLGEGATPLIAPERLRKAVGLSRLFIKNDAMLPTGSLKDRRSAVGVSRAKEVGAKAIALPSTGNGGASVAAYAARAGIPCFVLVPASTAPAKIAQAQAYGARIVRVNAGYDDVASLYMAAQKELGWFDGLTSEPFSNEGKKSYAFEVWEQLGRQTPDWMIHPSSSGVAIVAAYKGFAELREVGWASQAPRMVLAQAAACAPFVRAWEKGAEVIEPVTPERSVAESIMVGRPRTLSWHALRTLRESRGVAAAASEREILLARDQLGALAGIFAEPAGAVSLACAASLRQSGVIGADDLVVCVASGNGLKQPYDDAGRTDDEAIEPNIDALTRLLARRHAGML